MLSIAQNKLLTSLIVFVIVLLICFKAKALTGKEVYRMVSDSVYQVEVYRSAGTSPTSLGSAVAISKNILVTNCHVIEGQSKIFIVDNNSHYTVRLYKMLYDNDICLLSIAGLRLKPVNMIEANFIEVGTEVYAVGSPLGISRSFSQGVISQKEFKRGAHYFFTDTSIAPGSSGGGLFDAKGNLIGITTQSTRSEKNVGNPINIAVSVDMLIPYEEGNRFSELKEQKPSGTKDKRRVQAQQVKVVEPIKYKYQTRTISKYGEYGDSHINLLYDIYGCKIYIPGKTESGKTYGSVVVLPEFYSDIIFVLPYSGSIHEGVNATNRLLVDGINAKGKNLRLTDNTIKFTDISKGVRAEKEYLLAESLVTTSEKSEYVGVFNFDVIDRFIRDNDFEVILRNRSQAVKRTYGLWGFSEAMSHLNACQDKHSKVFGR